MTMVNFGIVLAFDFLLPKYGGSTNLFNMLFFVLLLTMLVIMAFGSDYGARMVYDYNAGGSACPQPIEFGR